MLTYFSICFILLDAILLIVTSNNEASTSFAVASIIGFTVSATLGLTTKHTKGE